MKGVRWTVGLRVEWLVEGRIAHDEKEKSIMTSAVLAP
jgi:hypothetical protein